MPQFLAGIGIIGALAYFTLFAMGIYFTLHGLYLAFCASIIIGILAFFIQPAPFIIGLVYFLTGTDLAQTLATALGW